MALKSLLDNAKEKMLTVLDNSPQIDLPENHPPVILFFAISDSQERANVEIATGKDFEDAWRQGVDALNRWRRKNWLKPVWLRVEIVRMIEALEWSDFQKRLSRTKRSYFRYGIAFTEDFKRALLEHELYGNAILYHSDSSVAIANEKNLKSYTRKRFRRELNWPQSNEEIIYRFKTYAVFTDGQASYEIEPEGRNSGYRIIDQWDHEAVTEIIHKSTDYLAKQVKSNGFYHYGWFPCFDRPIPTYNALRHASSTYALLEGWEVCQKPEQKQAIDRALDYLEKELIKVETLPNGAKAAFLVDVGDEIKLGGNAVSILAYAKYTEITGDKRYLELMEHLANGILFMQQEDGRYIHVLNYPELTVKAENRTIYYDGEAAFGLMRLYGITKDPRWLASVEKAFDYFIANRHWEAHDHWQSYCVNELTLYNPDPKYYQFGLDNVRDHLDFVLNRITTFPTLLELMMAAERMISRMQQDERVSHLLEGFDVDKFYQALEYRARYLMNGFFYPEVAMFFKNPRKILDGFFIRHHAFRVRIDDVEHYLSGFVAYRKYLKKNKNRVPLETVCVDDNDRPLLMLKNLEKNLTGKWTMPLSSANKSVIATGIAVTSDLFQKGRILIGRGASNKGFLSVFQVNKLIDRGASAIICEDPTLYQNINIPIFQVENVRKAVVELGSRARELFGGTVIGVTGSAGKTTTVSLLSQALSLFGLTGSSERSANLPVGIAWNQVNMPEDSKYWVIEMAIGSMSSNAQIADPNIAIITNIAPAHLEYHRDTLTIAQKKSAIMDEMRAGETLILYGEIEHKNVFLEKAKEKLLKIISYGYNSENDIYIIDFNHGRLRVQFFTDIIELQLPTNNEYIALNFLAILAVLHLLKLDVDILKKEFIKNIFSDFTLPKGRGDIVQICNGEDLLTIHDSTYNANPLSMKAAIATLKNVKKSSRFLILGDMKELGTDEVEFHLQLLEELQKIEPAKLILCGPLMGCLWKLIESDNLLTETQKAWFPSVEALLVQLPTLMNWMKDQDHIVLKASNSMNLNKVVEALKDRSKKITKTEKQIDVYDDSFQERLFDQEDYQNNKPVLDDRSQIINRGEGQVIICGKNVRLIGARIIMAKKSQLILGDNIIIRGYIAISAGCKVTIGSETICNYPIHAVVSENSCLNIGKNCLLSDVSFYTSDTHSIFDRITGQRINRSKDINVGDRVWFGRKTWVMKGAEISHDSVIAAGAMVTGKIPPHTISAGVPAKVIREDILWCNERREDVPDSLFYLMKSAH